MEDLVTIHINYEMTSIDFKLEKFMKINLSLTSPCENNLMWFDAALRHV